MLFRWEANVKPGVPLAIQSPQSGVDLVVNPCTLRTNSMGYDRKMSTPTICSAGVYGTFTLTFILLYDFCSHHCQKNAFSVQAVCLESKGHVVP